MCERGGRSEREGERTQTDLGVLRVMRPGSRHPYLLRALPGQPFVFVLRALGSVCQHPFCSLNPESGIGVSRGLAVGNITMSLCGNEIAFGLKMCVGNKDVNTQNDALFLQ